MLASVGQRRHEKPDASVDAGSFCVKVEVPLAARETELIASLGYPEAIASVIAVKYGLLVMA